MTILSLVTIIVKNSWTEIIEIQSETHPKKRKTNKQKITQTNNCNIRTGIKQALSISSFSMRVRLLHARYDCHYDNPV